MKKLKQLYCKIFVISIVVLMNLNVVKGQCSGSNGFWNCGYHGWSTCYQSNGGSFWTCYDPSGSYGQYPIGSNTGTYNAGCNCYDSDDYSSWCCGYDYRYINMAMYRKCSWQCTSCNGQNNPHSNCQSCRGGYYLWSGWGRCYSYCPSVSIGASGFGTNSVGQYKVSDDNNCRVCDSRCNFCNGPSYTDCWSCVAGYYFIDDTTSQCTTRFSTTGYGPQYSCYYSQCFPTANTCPTFYFYVSQWSVNNVDPYYTWGWASCQTNAYDNGCVYNRRINNDGVCYFCNSHCQTCQGPYQTDCLTCKRFNYMWAQRPNYCQQSCPLGIYTWNTGDWRGQFINQGAINTATGIGDRQCYLCNIECRWCRSSATNCLQCRNNYFLMDLYAQCMAKYITPNNCTQCKNSTYNMCQNTLYRTNRVCKTSCPTYFYFPVYYSVASTDESSVNFAQYASLVSVSTTAPNETYINGTDTNNIFSNTDQYRKGTNLCMLCDYRCIKCTGPRNSQCSLCRNGYYKWTNNTVCDDICPIGQYIALDLAYPANQTQCNNCGTNCLTCERSSVNCSTCKGANYAFSSVAFLYAYNDSYSQCMTTCPISTSSTTSIGYYGSFRTLACYPCPSPCSNCDISIIRNNYPYITCGSDNFCSNGLVCTSCLLGYVVVGGKCISQNLCRTYSYYEPPSVSAPWSAVNCKCLEGYSSSIYATCNIRCHISCKTCTGTATTNCATCYTGYYLHSSNQCLLDSNTGLRTRTWVTGNSYTNTFISPMSQLTCGSFSTMFGYQQVTQTTNKYFGYTFTTTGTNYYAYTLKIGLLFVDEYNTRGAIYLARDTNTSAPIWTWNYDTKNAYGQQLCGTNKMDYVLFTTAQISTRNYTTQTFYLTTNQNLLENNLGYQLHWGLYGILVTVLKCHSSCSYCSGPTANDCIGCTNAAEVAINGICVCDINNNKWKWADGVCRSGCTSNDGWFRDNSTRSCVKPPTVSNCTAPYRFGDSMGTAGYGWCVTDCPTNYYASFKVMKCTNDCWTTLNQYKYNPSKTCQDICPTGYIKDILNRLCVLVCPSGYYFQIQNSTSDPTCTNNCLTGWQFDGLQICINTCPSGYFRQTISSHNKCVSVCTNAFGDPTSGNCTLSCPFPSYADPNSKLCVDTCSSTNQFMQVSVSNLNRTCVSQCQSGQWGNPINKKCSNYTTDCPDGYYADSYTRMCESNCTRSGEVAENSTKQCRTSCLTGFAHWDSRACVQICPSSPPMFGYLVSKICVYNCNFSLTGLYGDDQANRTCVQKCSSSPTPTFGQNSSSLCVVNCTGSTQFGDPADIYRRCVTSCSSVPIRYANPINKECVLVCPDSYYGQISTITNSGICAKSCISPLFGDPTTNWCRSTCRFGYYGWPSGIRPCLQLCPRYWFGMNGTTNRVCIQTCDDGFWGDIQTSMCYNAKNACSNDTYADSTKKLCVINTNCTVGTFADPFTKGCQISCSNGYYADSNINTCVQRCSQVYDEYGQWGICTYVCQQNRFADPQANRTCVRFCSRSPLLLFGVIAARRICVTAVNCPTNYYGNNNTLTCVNPCSGTLPFGDPISRFCVIDCPDGYFGDINLNLCVPICNSTAVYFADNITGNCSAMCSEGTYGVNASIYDPYPSCQQECPPGSYALNTTRICVANCGSGFYGDPITRKCYSNPVNCFFGYFANSVANLCVLPQNCQTVGTHYFAQNSTKTCVQKCLAPNYGDSKDWFCYQTCNQTSYGENTTRQCKTSCLPYNSYAEDQNNLCVARCSNSPVMHYAQDGLYTCVKAQNCPIITTQTYAQNSTQKCVPSCGANEWADPTTLRCVAVCPNGYYADDSSGRNLCTPNCPDPSGSYRFRDNSTKRCVPICPASNKTFGDITGDQCVYTCPNGTFAQNDTNRRCVGECAAQTWGNKETRLCITNPITQCPNNTWGDNFTHLCQKVCSSSSGYYGYNVTRLCVTSCPSPTFAWDGSRVCIDICPASLNDSGYFGDPLPTRKCFLTCQTANYYRDIAASRTCVTSCTFNSTYKTYKDPTTMSCQKICSTYPLFLYVDDTLKSCQVSCSGTMRKNDVSQTCVATCPYLYDPTTNKCVDICPTQSTVGPLFANLTNNNNTCIIATSCPNNTYADFDSRTCTTACPSGTYKNGKYCVYICPNGFYMDNSTQSCVVPVNCTAPTIADNQTRSCVSQCIGTFYQSTINTCIDVCYGQKYGDPYTRTCVVNCSQGLYINTLTRTCVSSCAIGLYANPTTNNCTSFCSAPYYADNNSMACVTNCPANPMTFATDLNSGARWCVSVCQTNKMHDMINRICVTINGCPVNTYSYSINMSCVAFCPSPSYYQLGTACVTNCSSDSTLKYADNTLRKCVSSCPTGFYRDVTTYQCVQNCQSTPTQYYASPTQGNCTLLCPNGTFADPQQLTCVENCSLSPPMFAETVNRVCVSICPLAQNSFADPTTRRCVTSCPTGYFADSRDRTCKLNCSYLFADSFIVPKACVSNCSTNYFADPLTFICTLTCSPGYYKHTPTRQCVKFCPYGYYLNPLLLLCVLRSSCPTAYAYADNLTRTCTNDCSNGQFGFLATGTTTGGTCTYYCSSGFFSNPNTGRCVLSCPNGLFSDTTNNTCQPTCPYNRFMDSINNKCQIQCPSANNLFADLYNRTCVSQCDPETFTYADTLTRQCQQTCTGNQYADETTRKCVGPLQCSGSLFSDPYLKKCVQICYNGTYGYLGRCLSDCPTSTDDVYASQQKSICVSALNCSNGTYGDPILHKCVEFCPIQSSTFADEQSRKCLPTCNTPLFADNITRRCVNTCQDIPKMYGDTINLRCVLYCQYPYYADQTTNLCKRDCPNGYFADSSTLTCVEICPQGKFGNNLTNTCQNTCPSSPASYFGDPETKKCVLYCPPGKFADVDNNRECQKKCIGNINTFAQNSTRQCKSTCITGYSNPQTKQCIAVCSAGYYGYNKKCYLNCPNVSPTVFADNVTHLCVQNCPNGTFADYSTLRCVKICPIQNSTFGDQNSWTCTERCPGIFYADSSTRMCVSPCPSVPATYQKLPQKICISKCASGFYADNRTRSCVAQCPFGTYADNTTMRCELKCPTQPMMYGQNITNTCVFNCWEDRDMYADNLTGICVYVCSLNSVADLTSHKCVQTCPLNYYAINRTRRCQTRCEQFTFADILSRKCVSRCPIDPVYYGDTVNRICLEQCLTGSFGNPINQQCVYDTIGGISTCPPGYFADPSSLICVKVCPKKYDLYADPHFTKCRGQCSNGLIADNSTMRCVVKCPQYPSYFANLLTMRCIPFCPAGTYADQYSRICINDCPNGTYADNSTWRCVQQCPQYPLMFADDYNWTCVKFCSAGTFADYSTFKCVVRCPINENTFAQDTTRNCVRVCPDGSFGDTDTGICVSTCTGNKYADNSSNLCVAICPQYPPYYADPTTNKCVRICPPSYFSYQDNRTCVQTCPSNINTTLYRQSSTSSCVKNCNYQQSTYADNSTGYCVFNCSPDSWADPIIRVCVAVCPDQPLMYADNSTQTCAPRCPGTTFGQNTTRTCVNSCPLGSLSLPQNNLCVRYCPIGYFAYNTTAFCYSTCPGNYYGDPSTRSCVLTCSLSQLLYADSSTKQCVTNCPAFSYADKVSVSCVSVCPTADPNQNQVQTYAANYNNICVQECALPYFAYLPTKQCVALCPNPYFNNLVNHKCKLCPSVCLSCVTYEVCLTCIPTYYLQNGQCLSICSTGYYADSRTMKCVPSALCKPNYGVNSTNQCSSTCPAGSFANNQFYRCDACQYPCLTCLSWNYCLTCDTNTSIMYQNFCYLFCELNDTNINGITQINYSPDNSTCYQNCPNSTYLFVIFCKNCSSNCQTCNGTKENCTRCANGLYLQNQICVTECSTGYKPVLSRNCIFCGTNCSNALTFNTNITQINGQNTVFVTFSSNITLSGDPNKIFGLVPKSKRRLLANGYTVVVVDANTVKIILDNSIDAQSFTVQINQPQSIQDQLGNLPAKVRDEVVIDLTNTYSTTLQTAASGFSTYFAILAAACVISFLFDIEFMKFMQLLFVHYFVVMTVPPQLSKILLAFRYSTLNYLPTMYSVPKAVLRATVSGKEYDAIGDLSFLRNGGFALTVIVVMLIIWIFLKILSVPEINRFKQFRKWCKEQLDQKFKFAIQIQLLSIIFLNTTFFTFMQMQDYSNYDEFSVASIAISHILLAVIVIILVYIAYKVISFFRQYPKLSENLKKATDLLLQENQYHKLNSGNIFLYQMKKIDLRNLFYPKVNNQNILPFRNIYKFSFLALCCLQVTYLRAIILSLIIVFGTSTIMQMALCIPLNVLCLLYFSRARPYSFKYRKRRLRNYIAIFHEAALIIFQLLMLVLGILDRDMSSSSDKQNFSIAIIYYLCLVCSISFIYFLFRIGVQIYRRIWWPLTMTQIFKRNFPNKYAELHEGTKQKLVKGVDPKAKQALRALIKGYKKNKSSLRPTQEDKVNPKIPMKYKITYFDRDTSSINTNSSMSKTQKRKMLQQIFQSQDNNILKQPKIQIVDYEQMTSSEKTQAQYEEYEQEIEIKAKDLSKYVKNAEDLLKIKKNKQQDNLQE